MAGRPAKIAEPRLIDVYPRKRLFKRLDAAQRRPVVWISAPAGSGKTTLVASYLAARRRPRLWYRADEGDGDVAGLFYYLGLAAQALPGARRGAPLPVLSLEYQAGLPAFARRFFESLFARAPRRTVIVFDNYQEVPHDSRLHEVLREAMGALPAGLTLVLLSREDPPPAFARHAAGGEIDVLGWADLRLTQDETAGLARLRMRSRRTQALETALPAIHEIADGWAAGLVLLLERARTGDLGSVQRADAAPAEIFDYFATEVFEKLDRETQRILLATAVLPTVDDAIAAELGAVAQASRLLARLARDNFFIERHGAGEIAYRYHPLFRAFLLERALATFGADRLRDLRRQASGLLVPRGRFEEALALLREAGDAEGSVGLILHEAPKLMGQGRMPTLAGWLAALPESLVSESGWLCYWQAVCSIGHAPERSLALFSRAFQRFGAGSASGSQPDTVGACLACAGAAHAIAHHGTDFHQLDGWMNDLERVLAESAQPLPVEVESQVATAMLAARTQRRPGDPSNLAWAERALRLAREAGDMSHRLLTGGLLVIFHSFFGALGHAVEVLGMLREIRRRDQAEPLGRVTNDVAAALHAWVAADVEECRSAVSRGLEVADGAGVLVWNDQLCSIGAALALSLGDVVAARPYIERMAASATRSRFALGNYHFYSGWEALLSGDLPRAERCAAVALEEAIALGSPFALALGHIAQGIVAGRREAAADATWHLAEAGRLASETGSRLALHAALLSAADLAAGRGDEAHALDLLRRGLRVAREGGVYNMFWAVPAATSRLSVLALEHDIEPEYVRELVRRRAVRPDPAPIELEAWPWKLKLHTLGRFAIERGGEELTSTGKAKQMPLRLLKVVIAGGGRGVSQEMLTAALWPDTDGDAARRVFDTTLHRLRRLLGEDDAIRLHDGRLTLDDRTWWVDLWALERALDRATAARQDPASAGAAVQRVLALYRGPFLAGEDPRLCARMREKIHRRVLRSLTSAGGLWEGARNMERAAELYQAGLEIDDLAEPLYQGLMRCHHQRGQRGEAILVYDRCRKALRASLGIEPSPATRALLEGLVGAV